MKARLLAEHGSPNDAGHDADRGSDMGECMEFLDEELDSGDSIRNDEDHVVAGDSQVDCVEHLGDDFDNGCNHIGRGGDGVAPLDEGLDFSGTELLHASGTEPACACACLVFLNDECDEGIGTHHGGVQ